MTTPVTPVADAALPLPDPADLGTWGARMAEMHRWMREDLRTGMNTLGDQTYANALAAASIANFMGPWSVLAGALAIPASVSHGGKLWLLLANVADVTAETPGVSASWQDVTPADPDYLVKSGQIGFFAMSTAPDGWLKANGAAISRTTYAALFSAIGTTFGVGDGSTTFNVPDARGYAPRGWDDGRGIDTGRVFGSTQDDGIKTSKAAMRDDSNGNSPWAGAATQFTGEFTSGGSAGSSTSMAANATVTAREYLQIGTAPETRMKNIALLTCIKY